MKWITNTQAITLFINGETIQVEKTHKHYPRIIEVFQLPVDDQEAAVLKIIKGNSLSAAIASTEGFEIINGETYYDGYKLPKAFSDKIVSIVRDGLPLDNFVKFWQNLEKNPSFHVVNETGFFEFLEYQELPITDDGCFLAYRGVSDDYWSVQGSLTTKVLQGQVSSTGKIFNGIGEVIEVQRNGVSDDRNVHCHEGSLHIGSLDYARGWGSRIVIVKVNPMDVVSVPTDCNSQKCRVSKFEVLLDFVQEITASVVDEKGEDTLIEPEPVNERPEFIDKVWNYLNTKREYDGVSEVTIRQIQNSFSPIWPSKEKVIDALQDLGEYLNRTTGIVTL